jgi:RimJ/RimL family protein N-acetyltransferase
MIRGELTNLRAVERTDAPFIFDCLNAVTGEAGWPRVAGPVSLAETQRRVETWIDDERALGRPVVLVCENLEGTPLGLLLFSHFEPDHRAVEVDLLCAASIDTEKGLLTDALRSAVETCFDQWNLHRVSARAPVEDARRSGAFEACGFQRDAVLRQAAFFDGGYHDVGLYCLLESDDDLSREVDA